MGAVFTETEKTQILYWMGAGRLYAQLWPKLINAMQAVLSVADGGSQPDDTAVLAIQGWLTTLASIETSLTNLYCQMQVMEAGSDRVKLDPIKAIYALRSEGRRYVGHISDTLGTRALRDVWSSPDYGYEPGIGGQAGGMSNQGY